MVRAPVDCQYAPLVGPYVDPAACRDVAERRVRVDELEDVVVDALLLREKELRLLRGVEGCSFPLRARRAVMGRQEVRLVDVADNVPDGPVGTDA